MFRGFESLPIRQPQHKAIAVYPTDLRLTTHYYSSVYSRHGQDGYISEIYSRIGVANKTFLEIGVESGVECNTRFLLETGWRGIWIDSNEALLTHAQNNFAAYLQSGALKIVAAWVTPENVAGLISENFGDGEIDFMSIDVDQHTHLIWESISQKSRVSCIEYNSSLPCSLAVEVPYVEGASWDGSNYFGASLKSLELIGKHKNQHLVGCDSMGADAFFVDSSVSDGKFQAPFTSENHYVRPGFGIGKDHLLTGWGPKPFPRAWKIRTRE